MRQVVRVLGAGCACKARVHMQTVGIAQQQDGSVETTTRVETKGNENETRVGGAGWGGR